MRRITQLLLLVVFLLGALPATASAAESESTFTIRFRSGETGALQELESLVMTVGRAWQTLEEPSAWDAGSSGPFASVRRGADYRVTAPLPGEATVTVTISPEDALPSEAASVQALANALLARVLADADTRIQRWRDRLLSAPGAALDAAEQRLERASSRATDHRKRWGDVTTEHRMAADRLQAAAADLARTRIDLAVAARRLETARTAVERAAESDELRRRAAEIERKLKAGEWRDPKIADEMRRSIDALRQALAEAERKSPPLAESRSLAFDLEVEMVGLEARQAALEPEITELRRRVVDLVRAAAESRVIESELNEVRTTRNARRDDREELEARLVTAGVIVVTSPTRGMPRKR